MSCCWGSTAREPDTQYTSLRDVEASSGIELSKALNSTALESQALDSQVLDNSRPDEPEKGEDGCWVCTKEAWSLLAQLTGLYLVAYYADMGLDFNSIRQMFATNNPIMGKANIAGIVVSHVYGFFVILGKVRSGEIEATWKGRNQGWIIWVAGALYVPMLHVAFLACVSYGLGEIHPVLNDTKYVEATLESMFSANIQVYFIIWETLEDTKRFWLVVSIVVSFGTLSLSFASFDLKSKGIDGLRGTLAPFSGLDFKKMRETKDFSGLGDLFKFGFVCFFRFCELMSRIVSLCLFQRVWCQPVTNVVGINLSGVFVVAVDFFVLLPLIHNYGCNKWNAFQAAFAYMNPMLETGNVGSVPERDYFLLRIIELSVMIFTAFSAYGPDFMSWYDLDLTEHPPKKRYFFQKDVDILIAFAASTMTWIILWYPLRSLATCSFSKYEEDFLIQRQFTRWERHLLEEKLEEGKAKAYAQLESDVEIDEIETTNPLKEQLLRPVQELTRKLQMKMVRPLMPETAEVVNDEVAKRLYTLAKNCPVWLAETEQKMIVLDEMNQMADVTVTDSLSLNPAQESIRTISGVDVAARIALSTRLPAPVEPPAPEDWRTSKGPQKLKEHKRAREDRQTTFKLYKTALLLAKRIDYSNDDESKESVKELARYVLEAPCWYYDDAEAVEASVLAATVLTKDFKEEDVVNPKLKKSLQKKCKNLIVTVPNVPDVGIKDMHYTPRAIASLLQLGETKPNLAYLIDDDELQEAIDENLDEPFRWDPSQGLYPVAGRLVSGLCMKHLMARNGIMSLGMLFGVKKDIADDLTSAETKIESVLTGLENATDSSGRIWPLQCFVDNFYKLEIEQRDNPVKSDQDEFEAAKAKAIARRRREAVEASTSTGFTAKVQELFLQIWRTDKESALLINDSMTHIFKSASHNGGFEGNLFEHVGLQISGEFVQAVLYFFCQVAEDPSECEKVSALLRYCSQFAPFHPSLLFSLQCTREKEFKEQEAGLLSIVASITKVDTTRWQIEPKELNKTVPVLTELISDKSKSETCRYLALYILCMFCGDGREDQDRFTDIAYQFQSLMLLRKAPLGDLQSSFPKIFKWIPVAALAKGMCLEMFAASSTKKNARSASKSEDLGANSKENARQTAAQALGHDLKNALLKRNDFAFEQSEDTAGGDDAGEVNWILVAVDYLSQLPFMRGSWEEDFANKLKLVEAQPRFRRMTQKIRFQIARKE